MAGLALFVAVVIIDRISPMPTWLAILLATAGIVMFVIGFLRTNKVKK